MARLAILGLFLGLALPANGSDIPWITLAYSPTFDEACAARLGQPLEPEAVEELNQLMPAFESAWLQDGPEWLAATRVTVGHPFSFREVTARLVTCGIASRSRPVVINVRPHLQATAGRPADLRQFASTVFHELLHQYVIDSLDGQAGDTPLLRKYAGEPAVVRDHLHLFAVEEAVYQRRGQSAELRAVEAFQARLIGGKLFGRAREIVEAEGIDAFLAELRADQAAANRRF